MSSKSERRCPACHKAFTTQRGLHWHLRREHDYTQGEAYDAVGRTSLNRRKEEATADLASSTESDVRSERAAEPGRVGASSPSTGIKNDGTSHGAIPSPLPPSEPRPRTPFAPSLREDVEAVETVAGGTLPHSAFVGERGGSSKPADESVTS